MEIIIGLIVIGVATWWFVFRKKPEIVYNDTPVKPVDPTPSIDTNNVVKVEPTVATVTVSPVAVSVEKKEKPARKPRAAAKAKTTKKSTTTKKPKNLKVAK